MAIVSPQTNFPASGAAPGTDGVPLLWKTYLKDYDMGMSILIFGGGTIILVAGGLAGVDGRTGIAGAVLGGLLATMIALAAGVIGAFAGFLFGLPRTLTSNELRGDSSARANDPANVTDDADAQSGIGGSAPASAQQTQSGALRSSYTDVNTNLEQISDWLTKIIVGVGLTQINRIPTEIDAFGNRVAVYFGSGGKVLAIGAGLYALILGFFLAYVFTRVRLSLIFTASQRNNNRTSDGDNLVASSDDAFFVEAARASPGEGSSNPAVRRADSVVLHSKPSRLLTVGQMRARANALARSAKPIEARKLYEQILQQVPPTSDLLADYAQVLSLAGDSEKSREVLGAVNVLSSSSVEKREAARKVGEAELRGEVLAGLYGRDGKDYEHAIAKLEELSKLPGKDRDLWVHIWSACAHGQRYAVTKQEDDRTIVRDEVRKALEIEPKRKSYLASLFDPKLVKNGENDLVSLYPDEELDALLLTGTSPTP